MIRRKPIDDDDDDDKPDRWLVSYADFITLLFAFFVVMYAISSVNLSKYDALAYSIDSAFAGEINLNRSVKPMDVKQHHERKIVKPLPLSYLYAQKSKREQERMAQLGSEIVTSVAPLVQDGKVRVSLNSRGIRIDINESLLFTSGSATLAPTAVEVIEQILPSLKANMRLIEVEGHTDLTPIHTDFFYSNWELSAVRATTVLRLLIERGIDEKRLSAVGYGSTRPLSTSDTMYAQAKNRRVSMMVLYETQANNEELQEIKPMSHESYLLYRSDDSKRALNASIGMGLPNK